MPKEGLEPSHPKAQEPKSCVSTNSTIPARLASLSSANRGTVAVAQYNVKATGHVDKLKRDLAV